MGAKEKIQSMLPAMSEEELAQLASVAETIMKRHDPARGRLDAALDLFTQHRGAYRGDFDRESVHDR
jgi:hypothetical protein